MIRLKTSEVADLLKVPYHALDYLLRSRQIPRPAKDASGDLIWSEADVRRAREVLTKRAKKSVEVTAN
jgi:DNA-binding transcriptional MerR regulator